MGLYPQCDNYLNSFDGVVMKLKLFCIFCACVAIVYFTWISILAIGVCTLVYIGVKILLETRGKKLYNWVLNKLS